MFSRLLPCECIRTGEPLQAEDVEGKMVAPSRITKTTMSREFMAADNELLLIDELEGLKKCTFATFCLDRPLVPEVGDMYIETSEQWATLETAFLAVKGWAQTCKGGLWLWGPNGVGKSHLAAAAALEAVRMGIRVGYATAPRWLDYLRSGQRDHTFEAKRDRLERMPLLVLDDLEPHEELSPDGRMLFELVNARDLLGLPTIATSNWAPEYHAPRVRSRLLGMTRPEHRIALVVSDMRPLKRNI